LEAVVKCPDDLIAKLAQNKLSEGELDLLDRHLATCADCRRRVEQQAAPSLKLATFLLFGSDAPPEHLSDEQIAAYFDGDLDEEQVALVESHIWSCANCAVNVEEVRRYRQKMGDLVDKLALTRLIADAPEPIASTAETAFVPLEEQQNEQSADHTVVLALSVGPASGISPAEPSISEAVAAPSSAPPDLIMVSSQVATNTTPRVLEQPTPLLRPVTTLRSRFNNLVYLSSGLAAGIVGIWYLKVVPDHDVHEMLAQANAQILELNRATLKAQELAGGKQNMDRRGETKHSPALSISTPDKRAIVIGTNSYPVATHHQNTRKQIGSGAGRHLSTAPKLDKPKDYAVLLTQVTRALDTEAMEFDTTPNRNATTAGSSTMRIELLAPLRKTVLTQQPVFRFRPLDQVASYKLNLYAAKNYDKVTVKGKLIAPGKFVLETKLVRGLVYGWTIVASDDSGHPIGTGPSVGEPEALFKVANATQAAEVVRQADAMVRAAAQLMQLGRYEEARALLTIIVEADADNAGAKAAQKLLNLLPQRAMETLQSPANAPTRQP
jgi:hypothetical protein